MCICMYVCMYVLRVYVCLVHVQKRFLFLFLVSISLLGFILLLSENVSDERPTLKPTLCTLIGLSGGTTRQK